MLMLIFLILILIQRLDTQVRLPNIKSQRIPLRENALVFTVFIIPGFCKAKSLIYSL